MFFLTTPIDFLITIKISLENELHFLLLSIISVCNVDCMPQQLYNKHWRYPVINLGNMVLKRDYYFPLNLILFPKIKASYTGMQHPYRNNLIIWNTRQHFHQCSTELCHNTTFWSASSYVLCLNIKLYC